MHAPHSYSMVAPHVTFPHPSSGELSCNNNEKWAWPVLFRHTIVQQIMLTQVALYKQWTACWDGSYYRQPFSSSNPPPPHQHTLTMPLYHSYGFHMTSDLNTVAFGTGLLMSMQPLRKVMKTFFYGSGLAYLIATGRV